MPDRRTAARSSRRRHGPRRIAIAAAIGGVVLLAGGAIPVFAASPLGRGLAETSLPGTTLVDMIAAGQPVELDGVTIEGPVDLRAVDTATRVVRCTNCTFTGSIVASNTIFNRVVDLSGATINGSALFDGAVFKDAFLLRETNLRSASVHGSASFMLAAFHGRASFEGVQFGGDADFRVTQFLADASFAATEVEGAARFDSAVFDGRAAFDGSSAGVIAASGNAAAGGNPAAVVAGCPPTIRGSFAGPASFDSVTFADKVDFRQRCFGDNASFEGTTFGAVDFSLAVFRKSAIFDDASVDGAASFRVIRVTGTLSFQHVVLRGPATFEAAVLNGPVQLSGTSATDSLSLDGVTISSTIGLDKVQANGFEMDLVDLSNVPGGPVREKVLGMVEASARARGDLGLANDAAFDRSSLETDRLTGLDQASGILQREVAGYFVKPIFPLRAFAILFLLSTLVRFLDRRGVFQRIAMADRQVRPLASLPALSGVSRQAAVSASKTGLVGGSRVILDLAASAEATFRVAFGLKLGHDDSDDPTDLPGYGLAIARGAEWLTFKLLIAMFLLGLANSNPTFKQLIEAVRP